MNICRISRTFLPSKDGVSRHTYYLSKHQVAQGHKVFVLQPFLKDEIRDGIIILRINIAAFRKHKGKKRKGWKSSIILFCLAAIFKCICLYGKHCLDIIHCHGDAIESFFLGLLGNFLKVPVVLTIHGSLNKKWLYSTLSPRMFSFADQFIVVSEEIKRELLSLGVQSERIDVISSGINFSLFAKWEKKSNIRARKELGINSDVTVVVSIGRLHPVKGFRYLIDAAKILHRTSNLLFIIVGDGPERDELYNMAKELTNVWLVGSKPSAEVVKYLHSADIFILPSIDLPGQMEGTPTAVMEAMAAGLPIITTDSGGAKHLINNSQNGLIVRQKSPEELARAICNLKDNPQICQRMGEINQALAKEKDWSFIAQKVYQVYRKLLREQSRGIKSNINFN